MLRKVFACAFVLGCLFCACELEPKLEVSYRVTGTASLVDVTYENSSGGTSQEDDVSVPWGYKFEAESGTFVYVSAQNQGEEGRITVTIYVNGNVLQTSTSNGAYVIATASGTT